MSENTWLVAHFSPTGTTKKVALAVAEGSGCPLREIDLSAPVAAETVEPDAVLLAAMPVFGGRVPAVALERLAQLKGSGQKAVAVVVYGNRAYDNALLELKDTLEANGFQVVAAGAFIAEHSIVRSIAAGRPDAHDLEMAADFGAAVMKKLAAGGGPLAQVPGDPAYREKQAAGGSPAHPQAGEACIRCGVCAGLCPLGAIPADDPAVTDGSKCINCMRCVAVCPQKARALPAPMLDAVGGMLSKVAAEPKTPELFL